MTITELEGTISALRRDLQVAPLDATLRGILADALEDAGEEEEAERQADIHRDLSRKRVWMWRYQWFRKQGNSPANALRYAKALAAAQAAYLHFSWQDDEVVQEEDEDGYDISTTSEMCLCLDMLSNPDKPEVLASLGMITGADNAYRTIVEAQLALEALAQI